MYFVQRISKVDIAERLRLSRFQVARILEQALDEGYVHFQILEPEPLYPQLSAKIEDIFGINFCIIVDDPKLGNGELQRRVAFACGKHLLDILHDDDVLGISLGSTVQSVVESLPNKVNKNVKVVQLLGGGIEGSDKIGCNSLTWEMAKKFGSQPFFLSAPAFVDSPDLKRALLSDEHIQETYVRYKSLSVALVGIGAISESPASMLIRSGIIDPTRLARLIGQGVVGDVLVYTYDKNGNVIPSGLEDRTIAVPLDDYLNTPYRIGVASGSNKVRAIYGALKGGFINALVTDNMTALSVVGMIN
jgi:DNA-binding transcriptional regulator LsrR (DeoR family)